jgi:hypothetical protein
MQFCVKFHHVLIYGSFTDALSSSDGRIIRNEWKGLGRKQM